MSRAITSTQALQNRRCNRTIGGDENWRTSYFGSKSAGVIQDEPQAFLIEMKPNQVIAPHFHEVDQFQLFVAGAGSMGRNNEAVLPIALHYADHHTAYGPITSGSCGYSYFTFRPKTDPNAVYLSEPGYREKLQPSKRRHFLTHITLSSEPVLEAREHVAMESLIEKLASFSDGMGAWLLRMGANMESTGPDPHLTDGQYYVILNGTLQIESASYPSWSIVFVEPAEEPLKVLAGAKGLEVLILQYARMDEAQ